MSERSFIEKAEVISAIRDYNTKKTRRKDSHVDFMVSPSDSDDIILIRVITKTTSKSGYIGVDFISEMKGIMKKQDYDKGILIGKRFTEAAKREMASGNIEAVSEKISPHFNLEQLYSTINRYVQKLCKIKCDQFPTKKSDCKGYIEGHYTCKVRLCSDDADFHLEQEWRGFLERDLAKLLEIGKTLKD